MSGPAVSLGARFGGPRRRRERKTAVEPFLYHDFFHGLEEDHWWFVGRRRIVLDLIGRYVRPPVRILDAGCGTGYQAREMARFGEVCAFDSAVQAVRYAAARGVAARQGELEAIPYADGDFDLVTALDVLEHADDDRRALSEIARVLRPKGLLVLTVPAFRFLWSAHDEVNHHKRRYTARGLRRKVTEAGFAVLRLTYYNTALFAPIALVRLAGRLRSPAGRSDFSVGSRALVNGFLKRVLFAEAWWLRHADFPFGVSLVAVLTKLDKGLSDVV